MSRLWLVANVGMTIVLIAGTDSKCVESPATAGNKKDRGGQLCQVPLHFAGEKLVEMLEQDKAVGEGKLHADDSVSIFAAWLETQAKLQSEVADKAKDGPVPTLVRFVGFLEGRLRVKCPDWWSKMVLTATIDSDGVLRAKDARPWRYVSMHGVKVRKGMTVSVDEARSLHVSSGDKSMVLSRKDLDERNGVQWVEAIDVFWYADSTYVALSQAPQGCLLNANGFDGTTKWQVAVWGSWFTAHSGPAPDQYIEVCQFPDRVAVFGVIGSALYVEVFDKASGACKARFSTHTPATSSQR